MNKRLLMARHFCFAYSCRGKFNEFVFLLDEKSKVPSVYLEEIKSKLNKHFPNISYELKSEIEVLDNDLVLDFDSFDELKLSKGKLCHSYQNRLFDDLQFTCPDGFSSFRKKAEKVLPKYFNDVISPFDEETITYLDNYFSSPHPKTYFDTRNKMIGESFPRGFQIYYPGGLLMCGIFIIALKTTNRILVVTNQLTG